MSSDEPAIEPRDAQPQPQDRLRYKHKSRRNVSDRSRARSRSRSRTRGSRHGDTYGRRRDNDHTLSKEDEDFYGTGAAYASEPSLLSRLQAEDFREHLFDALADEEGRDYWQNVYGQPIHDFDRPNEEMTDDEYAEYVRRGMWNRKHKEAAHARRVKEVDDAEAEANMRDARQEADRSQQLQRQLLIKKQLAARWQVYLRAWANLGQTTWTITTVPWPTIDEDASNLSRTAIEAFLTHAGEARTIAREELRRRWHPDRFQQRAMKHVSAEDKAIIAKHVTAIAQILNAIIGG